METDLLAAACAAAAVIGVLLLAFAGNDAAPARVQLADVSDAHYGQRVEVTGEVKSAYMRNGNLFLTLCAGACLPAVAFKSALEAGSTHGFNMYALTKGDRISAVGTVKEYGGKPEIVLESARYYG